MKLEGKVAFVTGAASGIGRRIAEVYAREGARVAIDDLNESSARVAARGITANGGTAIAVGVDVTSESQVERAVAQTAEAFGAIDILVSNAGIQIVKAIEQLEFEEWRKLLAIHLDGAFLTTKACLKHMYAAKRGGSIIYMGSVHSKEASLLKAPYVTAKHGLIGLAKVVSKEGEAHGVRANVICPGFVRTSLVEKQIPEQASPPHLRPIVLTTGRKGVLTTGRMQPPSNSEHLTFDLFHAIVEQAPDAIIFADREGAIRVWNRGAETVFGFAAAEVLGKSLDVIIPERLRGAHWDGFRRAIDTGQTKYVNRVLTTRSVHKNGSKLYVDLSFGLVCDEAGVVTGALAVGRDCTTRYLSDGALRARVVELEKKESGGS